MFFCRWFENPDVAVHASRRTRILPEEENDEGEEGGVGGGEAAMKKKPQVNGELWAPDGCRESDDGLVVDMSR